MSYFNSNNDLVIIVPHNPYPSYEIIVTDSSMNTILYGARDMGNFTGQIDTGNGYDVQDWNIFFTGTGYIPDTEYTVTINGIDPNVGRVLIIQDFLIYSAGSQPTPTPECDAITVTKLVQSSGYVIAYINTSFTSAKYVRMTIVEPNNYLVSAYGNPDPTSPQVPGPNGYLTWPTAGIVVSKYIQAGNLNSIIGAWDFGYDNNPTVNVYVDGCPMYTQIIDFRSGLEITCDMWQVTLEILRWNSIPELKQAYPDGPPALDVRVPGFYTQPSKYTTPASDNTLMYILIIVALYFLLIKKK